MDQNKNARLFAAFPPIPTEAWEEKIREDLKGADYDKRLVWRTPEGLRLRPYYRREDTVSLPHIGALPGEMPFVRGNHEKGNDWVIRQDISEASPDLAAKMASGAVEKGAEAVGLNVSEVDSPEKMAQLLGGIDTRKTGIHLLHGKDYTQLFSSLVSVAGNPAMQGSLDFDPLGYFLQYASFCGGQEEDMEQAQTLVRTGRDKSPAFCVLHCNGQHYHNAGSSIVEELAFTLAQANEYLVLLTGKGLSADDIAPRILFTLPVGSSYFMEIAKLRAARMLWASIVRQHGPSEEKSARMNLHAVTSGWNKSVYDPYVNLLRTTTEAMAASVGGADILTVEPFDATFKKPDAFSSRLARNQQIILRHEAYFGAVADPAAGSYYVENLTNDIAAEAWKLFLEVEEAGGFISAVNDGLIRSAIAATRQKRDTDIATRKKVFVGTNLYPNTEERVLDKVQPTAKLTDLSGLRPYRGPQAFEALRMSVENHARKGFATPRVFLFTYGNPAMRKARATFTANFFGVAGYEIADNLGFSTIGDGVKAALSSGARIVVLCSSDEEYPEMAPAAKAIKKEAPDTLVVVAGYPKDQVDQLREEGVDSFIHIRTNVLEALEGYNRDLGIV